LRVRRLQCPIYSSPPCAHGPSAPPKSPQTVTSTVRQIQYILPPTVSAYHSWARQHSRLINIEEIPARSENEADTKLLWVGHWKEGGKVLLYLHGGGYVMPLVKQYLDLLTWVTEEPVAVLEYTNTPHERYRHQLTQAATAFAHLLEHGGKPNNLSHPLGFAA
jgi:acetyl esterase/lipase